MRNLQFSQLTFLSKMVILVSSSHANLMILEGSKRKSTGAGQFQKMDSNMTNCLQCHQPFEPLTVCGRPLLVPCPACAEKNAAETLESRKLEELRRLRAEWDDRCPTLFRDTLVERLPDQVASAAVLGWKPNPSGLLLYGKTRTGKSRTVWLLAERLHLAGVSVTVMDSMSGFEYGSVFRDGSPLDWVTKRSRCGVLLLDDVFKVKLTESFEAALFVVVDSRMNWKLPVVATLNDTGETLASRMTGDRGAAFVARLREMCETVVFK